MDYAKLIKMLMGGASAAPKAPVAPTAAPSTSPASGAGGMLGGLMGGGRSSGGNPMGMLSGLLGGGSKEEGPNPNLDLVKTAGTSMLSEGNSDEYMAKMNALRNMRNR